MSISPAAAISGHSGISFSIDPPPDEATMPTYTCTAASGLLDAQRKGAIARAVTLAHCEITGAPAHFAQVIFTDVAEGDHFVGGAPLAHDHVFVHGRIRAGRSAGIRETLIRRLAADVAAAAGVDAFSVWVYLLELPAEAMIEFGHVLPEAGEEPAWSESLPVDDWARMQEIGSLLGPDRESR
jgi:phenylpyruvate tautomerase PptA (4-oxalocrotonate tautomerase family)